MLSRLQLITVYDLSSGMKLCFQSFWNIVRKKTFYVVVSNIRKINNLFLTVDILGVILQQQIKTFK